LRTQSDDAIVQGWLVICQIADETSYINKHDYNVDILESSDASSHRESSSSSNLDDEHTEYTVVNEDSIK